MSLPPYVYADRRLPDEESVRGLVASETLTKFDERVEVPHPGAEACREILSIHLAGRPAAEDLDFEPTVEETAGFAASDLELLAEDAARHALRDDSPVIQDHLEIAVWETQSSIADWGGRERYQQTQGTTDLGYSG